MAQGLWSLGTKLDGFWRLGHTRCYNYPEREPSQCEIQQIQAKRWWMIPYQQVDTMPSWFCLRGASSVYSRWPSLLLFFRFVKMLCSNQRHSRYHIVDDPFEESARCSPTTQCPEPKCELHCGVPADRARELWKKSFFCWVFRSLWFLQNIDRRLMTKSNRLMPTRSAFLELDVDPSLPLIPALFGMSHVAGLQD